MPDDQKIPGKTSGLSKEFKEFAFGEEPKKDRDPAPGKPAPPPPVADGPVKLTKEDMNFVPYRGMPDPMMGGGGGMMSMGDDDEDMAQDRDWLERQERTFEAAGSMFRHERDITNALSMLSNLEMQSVIAAGILFEQYQGLPRQRRSDMVIAVLALNAENFDDIAGDLSPETVGMVDEIQRLQDEPDRKTQLYHTESLEPDSKRVLLALTVSDLEMAIHEMHEFGDSGPSKQEMSLVAEMICAMAPGVDKSMRQRAITAFNLVSAATENGATLKEKPDGSLVLNTMPDITIDVEEPAPAKKPQAASKQRKPKK